MVLKGGQIELGNCGMIAGAFSSTSGKADTVLTTSGDVLYYTSSRQRLPIGSEGTVLTVSSSDLPAWETASAGLSSPLTSNLVWNDNIEANFGTGGSDSLIKHDGSNWIFTLATGYMKFTGDFTLAATTSCMTNQRATATISSGAVTGTANTIALDTEGGASSDTLEVADYTAAGKTGARFTLLTQNDARDVTIDDHGTPNPKFIMAGDFTLDSNNDTIIFEAINGTTHNYELSRSSNA
tara:strand:+ start:177 stop:893 length:717 start_codon:yes stop_codon:yes gene_type:complete